MSSPADETPVTQEVVEDKPKKKQYKKARRIHKAKKPPEEDGRTNAGRQRSEAQIAAQFKPGNQAAAGSMRQRNAKLNRDFRNMCRKILNEAAMPMLVNRLYDAHDSLDTKHFIEILKFLTLYGVGRPGEMEVEEENNNQTPVVNNIVISQEMLAMALNNDKEHHVSSVVNEQ